MCNKNFKAKKHKRKFCDECFKVFKDKLQNKTKGELFSKSKNWQCARTSIRKHADKVFKENNGQYKCLICGYDKHVEICHKKQVKDFDNSETLKEINSFSNLVALCPTHHWEFDNGILKI